MAALLFPRPIGEPEIAKIAALADPVLRNLWITTAYHDFAVGMARLVGPANVSWPAFATWASKTAGASIRGEVLPRRIRDVLSRSWAYRRAVALVKLRLSGTRLEIDVDIFDAIREAVAAVSQQIAAGNLTVFQELGPLFARMVATFDGPGPGDPTRRAALIAWVQALDGDAVATARLRTVFGQFCDAMLDAERTLRADRILLANGLAGLTEQIRLQPNIQGALDAPIETSLGEWLDRTVAKLPVAVRAGARPVLRLVVIEVLRRWARHLWPASVDPATGEFRWELLAGGGGVGGAARFDSQFWRANVDPSDHYVLSLPGTGRHRIKPGETGFDNLVIAGDWTDCGLNAGCVEAAVVSGRLAAHALTGVPRLEEIVGYTDSR